MSRRGGEHALQLLCRPARAFSLHCLRARVMTRGRHGTARRHRREALTGATDTPNLPSALAISLAASRLTVAQHAGHPTRRYRFLCSEGARPASQRSMEINRWSQRDIGGLNGTSNPFSSRSKDFFGMHRVPRPWRAVYDAHRPGG